MQARQARRGGSGSSSLGPGTVMHPQHNLESLSQRPGSAAPLAIANPMDSAPSLGSASTLGSSTLTPPTYSLLYVHLFLCCTCASGMLSCQTLCQHSWQQCDTLASMRCMVIVRCNILVARKQVSWCNMLQGLQSAGESTFAPSCGCTQVSCSKIMQR